MSNTRIPIQGPEAPRPTAELSVLADAELARFSKALGHPVRVAILRHLIRNGQCVCGDIVELLPLAQSTVSQHLKVLKDAGLLLGEVDGPRVCYCANADAVRRLQDLVRELK